MKTVRQPDPLSPQVVRYGWDNDRIFAEYDASGNPIQETVYFGSTPIALLKDGKTYRIFADQIDTPRVITDNTNTTLWAWDSKPFGESQPDEDVDGDNTKLGYNLRFPGQYYDAETGKHYNFNRDYDPVTGRYVQSDPIGLDGGMNTYGYVLSSPVNSIDDSGLLRITLDHSLNRKDRALVHYAIRSIKSRISRQVVNYFNLFGYDINQAVQDGNGPIVVFTRNGSGGDFGLTTYSDIKIYLNTFDDRRPGYRYLYDANQIASTIIHEMGHWAHGETGWFFKMFWSRTNPSLRQIQAVVPAFQGTKAGIKDDAGGINKGGYYGYAATIAMFNRYLH